MTARGYAGRLAAAFLLYFLAILLVVLFLPTVSRAHDWYPIECCSGYDCAPVEKMTRQPDGGLWVTTKHGTGFVPHEMTRRESKDERSHACIRKTWDGEFRVICVFLPPST